LPAGRFGEGRVRRIMLGIVIVPVYYPLKTKNMKDRSRVIAALLIGAAAGAALGILFAPERGGKTRDGIADFIEDLVDAAKKRAISTSLDVRNRGVNALDKAKSKFRGAVNDVSEYKEEAINAARTKINNIKDEAQDALNDTKTNVKGTANDWNKEIQKS
ncbi:MAG: YtxH domain-containing protein, partial [Sphingobacteriales bacterium]